MITLPLLSSEGTVDGTVGGGVVVVVVGGGGKVVVVVVVNLLSKIIISNYIPNKNNPNSHLLSVSEGDC